MGKRERGSPGAARHEGIRGREHAGVQHRKRALQSRHLPGGCRRPPAPFLQAGARVRCGTTGGWAAPGRQPVAVVGEPGSQDGDIDRRVPEGGQNAAVTRNSGGGEVCWWKTTDGGLTWAKESCLISSPNSTYVASTLVRNAHPDGRMVVSEHNGAQNHLYRKLFLLGDSGPVGRSEAEASNLGDRLKNLDAAHPGPKPDKARKKGRNKPKEEDDGDE